MTYAALDDTRWTAVSSRDDSADGLFVYAVRTTGVFCRPSCSSRKPNRENVAFFPTSDDAVADGFRACHRCRPELAVVVDPATAVVIEVCRRLEAQPEVIDLVTLADTAGWSRGHMQRMFTRRVGVSPRQYAAAHRLHRAMALLRSGANVTDAVYGAGFGSSRGFYEQATMRLGMRPSDYARGGSHQTVRWTCVDVAIDEPSARTLLVASTERGLCAVRFGRSATTLVDELSHELPSARLQEAADELADVARGVLALYSGRPVAADRLPLDIRGTAFQAQVWEALCAIPAGTTRSYAEVAASIGRPTAVRAVASACAANPVALVVPCHRVVRSDGSLGGYRWGLRVKAALLANETAGVPR